MSIGLGFRGISSDASGGGASADGSDGWSAVTEQNFADVPTTLTQPDLTDLDLPDDSLLYVELLMTGQRHSSGAPTLQWYFAVFSKVGGTLTLRGGATQTNYTSGAGNISGFPTAVAGDIRIPWLCGGVGLCDITIQARYRRQAVTFP